MQSEAAFYWIGVGVVAVIAFAVAAAALFVFYARYLHGRFHLIPFRKGHRRLSIASWYGAKLMTDKHYHADDFPIGERPFYLSYQTSPSRRLFFMFGMIGSPRHMAISGKHPHEDEVDD